MKRKSFIIIGLILTLAVQVTSQEIDSVSVVPLNPKVATNTLYQVNFVSPVIIDNDALFSLTFPSEFDISNTTVAGSKSMDGGFTVSVQDSVLQIKRRGEGKSVNVGTPQNLMFSVVKNPDNEGNYLLQFRVLDGDENTILINQEKPIVIIK